MKSLFLLVTLSLSVLAQAQDSSLLREKLNLATSVKNQQASGTCWSFGTTSMVESESLRKGHSEPDFSVMFTVRNIYIEKAKNYILRQGTSRFDEGGLGHDVIHAMGTYGIIPGSVYSGKAEGVKYYAHGKMVTEMKTYLDSVLKSRIPIPDNWMDNIVVILNKYMGEPPATFQYNGKTYTPQSFAKEVVKFNEDDYIGFTSFTHHPFNTRFILEVPDNFSNGAYYNVPLEELLNIISSSLRKGYTVAWDADVSNVGWNAGQGYGLVPEVDSLMRVKNFSPDIAEKKVTQESRQRLFEELVTQDDHMMQITGIGQRPDGKTYFIVKNSWGKGGPFHGYLNVSEAYMATNTVSIVVPKAALDKALRARVAKGGK
ncbi:MAG: aminopeptidase [Chitinophaga sp.]|uniref:C1 family peptidase n=1 Tax=Chitinophaga sp. TaxID=1869181 RepID=UPI0025C45E2B|nr:C1 family peptidase [Chitinophaga sp.]MBV8252468.1 aminopeptidase [Chitinophaga sp.]